MKNGACAAVSLLKGERDELISYMKEHLVIKYKKTKGIKKYTKQIVKAIPVMKKKKKKKNW